MMSHRAIFARRTVAVTALISALSVMVSGCSDSEQDRKYATPDALCGVAVDPSEITPFLPGGKNISVREENSLTRKKCELVIDGEVAATSVREWLEGGKVTSDFVTLQTLDAVDGSADGGRFLYSGSQAFGKTRKCKDELRGQELYTSLQFWDSKNKDAEAMKRLIVDFTSQVEKTPDCAAGPSE